MAVTSYGVNALEAVKLWSSKLMHEIVKMAWSSKFESSGSDSLCQIKDETSKGDGDRVRCILRMQPTGAGVQGDDTLEGAEEALVTFTDDLLINQLRHGFRSGGKMTEQRIPFSIREEIMNAATDWWVDRKDTWFMNQLTGNTGVTDTRFTGNNATLAPTAATRVFPGVATAESNLSADTSQSFSLAVIDAAKLRATTMSPAFRPCKSGKGQMNFVMFISPEQHYDLRRNTATLEWSDLQKAAISGGERDNPIWTGALGMYNGVILHESFRLPRITTAGGANTGARSILCGAQAAISAYGRGHGPGKYSWKEKLFDYDNQLGVKAGCTAGLKKVRYNSADFAVITVATVHSAAAIAASGR